VTTLPLAFADHGFGGSPAFCLGVEEELLLVEPPDYGLSNTSAAVLAAMGLPYDRAGHEAFASEIELRTPPVGTAGEVHATLAELRGAARAAGATLMGAGLHPMAELGAAPLVDSERYRVVAQTMRGLITRTPDCAVHVHVAMPDPETAVRVLSGLREQLPLLVALGGNSPMWFGLDSGMASARYSHVRAYPRRGVPPAFADYAGYGAAIAELMRAGGFEDYTLVWWNLRLQPRIGTIEVREIDGQARLADVAALAALVQALARLAAEEPSRRAPRSADALNEMSFLAARDGLDAMVPDGDGRAALREVARRTLARAREHAQDLGSARELEGIAAILENGSGADRQRAALRTGGVPALLDLLVRETAEN
jgi:carboxylate-amine ligase